MAAGVTIKHKRKAGSFSNGELAAGEWGLDVTGGQWYFSLNGTSVVALTTDTSTLAPKASPALTGTPTAPTAAPGTNTTQISTTAFVTAAVSALIASAPGALDTLNELAASLGNDANFASTVTTALAGKQASDAELTALAALTSAANKLPYFTGSGTAALADISVFARTLLDDADQAAALLTLGAAGISHVHSAADITSGTMNNASVTIDGGTI